MRALYLHVDRIAWQPTQRALRSAEEPLSGEAKNALAIMVAVEEGDGEEEVKRLVEDVKEHTERIGVRMLVVYPWVHLSHQPAKPPRALTVIRKIEEGLKGMGFVVYRAPFGWYKRLILEVKGHPLAELSRKF